MDLGIFDVAAVLIVLAAVFGLINHHVLRLPFTIGLTLSGLVASGAFLALDALFPGLGLGETIRGAVSEIDFPAFLMKGVLGFLLFGGALHVNLEALLEKKWPVSFLAFFGVLISTVVVGVGGWALFGWVGVPVRLHYCLVFGALISPTDPVAVLGILKSLGAPRGLEAKISGESLLNDGVGVVLFSVLLAAAGGGPEGDEALEPLHILQFFGIEVLGGLGLGLACGYIAYRAMRTLDEPNLEILISVSLVMGITLLGFRLHTSGPLACVAAGLFIGNHGRRFGMSERTRAAQDLVWSFIDQTLNAVLFLLVGLEAVAVSFSRGPLLGAALAVPLVLLGRYISVLATVSLLRLWQDFSPGAVKILTWGGLKGGISVALALSLPREFQGREVVITATYAAVIFSIIVQGLTIGPLIRRLVPAERTQEAGLPGSAPEVH